MTHYLILVSSHSRTIRWLTVVLGFAVVSAAAAQTTTPAATVKIGSFTKRTVGTVTAVNDGDAACYLSLKDEQGKAFEEVADF